MQKSHNNFNDKMQALFEDNNKLWCNWESNVSFDLHCKNSLSNFNENPILSNQIWWMVRRGSCIKEYWFNKGLITWVTWKSSSPSFSTIPKWSTPGITTLSAWMPACTRIWQQNTLRLKYHSHTTWLESTKTLSVSE